MYRQQPPWRQWQGSQTACVGGHLQPSNVKGGARAAGEEGALRYDVERLSLH